MHLFIAKLVRKEHERPRLDKNQTSFQEIRGKLVLVNGLEGIEITRVCSESEITRGLQPSFSESDNPGFAAGFSVRAR